MCSARLTKVLHTALVLSLSSLLQFLDPGLPIKLGIKAQQLPSFLDTNQSFPWVLCLGVIFDIGEILLDELGCCGGECDIGICDIEDVGSF
jgi:hypothetical protein